MKKEKIKLSAEEKRIESAIGKGLYKKIEDDKTDYSAMAKAKKDRINLRVDGTVLDFFEKQAKKEGIPYQTLINNVLFKYAHGELSDHSLKSLNKKLDHILNEVNRLKKVI